MKKFITFMLAVMMVLALTACSSNGNDPAPTQAPGDTTKPAAEDVGGENNTVENKPGYIRFLDKDYPLDDQGRKIIKVYFCLDHYDESTAGEIMVIQQRIEELNSERDDVKVEFLGYSDGQSDINKQLGDIETAVAMNPDVILLKPVDSSACVPAIEAAYDAGVYTIENMNMETDKVDVHWVGVSEISVGRLLADHVKEYLEANPDVTFKAGLIYGAPQHVELLNRLKGLEELAEEMPDRFEVVATQYGMWATDVAQNTMEDWMQAHPEINFVATAADQMTLGVTNALKAAGILDDYYILSCNGSIVDVTLLGEGSTKAFISFDNMEATGKMVDAAVQLALGERAGQTNIIDNSSQSIVIVTPDELDAYIEKNAEALGME